MDVTRRVLAASGVQTMHPRLLALGNPPQPFPLDAHAYTGRAEVPVLPRPLLRTGGTQSLCPEDKDCCLETQSSGQSLHNIFPYQKQGAKLDVTLDASAARTKSRAATSPPAAPRARQRAAACTQLCPSPLPAQDASSTKSPLRGPAAPSCHQGCSAWCTQGLSRISCWG